MSNQTDSNDRLYVLDGWRGVSILLVLAAHLLPLGPKSLHLNEVAGAMGMSLFFTLSGFLIARLLLKDEGIVGFLIKRFFSDCSAGLAGAYYYIGRESGKFPCIPCPPTLRCQSATHCFGRSHKPFLELVCRNAVLRWNCNICSTIWKSLFGGDTGSMFSRDSLQSDGRRIHRHCHDSPSR